MTIETAKLIAEVMLQNTVDFIKVNEIKKVIQYQDACQYVKNIVDVLYRPHTSDSVKLRRVSEVITKYALDNSFVTSSATPI